MYHIIKDKELVVEVLKGPVKLHEYINLKKQQIEDEDFNSNYNFLIDIRAVEFVFSRETEKRMKEYLAFAKPIDALSKEKKTAIITSTPDQVVYSMINQSLDSRQITYNIFSTKDAALEWLNLSNEEVAVLD